MAELAVLSIPAIIGLINTPITVGTLTFTVKEIGLASLQTSWCIYGLFKKSTILTKLSNLLFFLLHNDFPSKKERKEFYKLIKQLFIKYDKAELMVIYRFYKKLKGVMRLVMFDDIYYKKNKNKLIMNPELMRKYAIKKLYIQRLHQLIMIKLYNHSPDVNNIKKLKDNLSKVLLNEDVEIEDVENFAISFEQSINNQYEKQKVSYDKDFEDEKKVLVSLLDDISKKSTDFSFKSAVNTIGNIVSEEKNIIEDPKKISHSLSNSMNEVIKMNNNIEGKDKKGLFMKLNSK